MSRRRIPTSRSAPPVRTLVADALREGKPLSTRQLLKHAREAAGRPFHVNSVRNALRALQRAGALSVARKGRSMLYSLKPGANLPTPRPRRPIRARAASAPASPARVAPGEAFRPPHHLAVGEVLILEIGAAHVETATNVHGKLVLERHARPRRPV